MKSFENYQEEMNPCYTNNLNNMNQDNNMVLRKALTLSYIFTKLALENIEVSVHEMALLKAKDAKRLKGYLNKLSEAQENAFKVIERNTSLDEVQAFRTDLNKLLDVSWEEQKYGN